MQAELKQLKPANDELRLYAKQKIEDKDTLLQKTSTTNTRVKNRNIQTKDNDVVNLFCCTYTINLYQSLVPLSF